MLMPEFSKAWSVMCSSSWSSTSRTAAMKLNCTSLLGLSFPWKSTPSSRSVRFIVTVSSPLDAASLTCPMSMPDSLSTHLPTCMSTSASLASTSAL